MATTPKTWQDGVLVTAADLNAEIRDPITALQTTVGTLQPKGDYATNTALTAGLASKAATSHKHTAADLSGVVKTVNGTAPDAAGNVVVSGGTGGTVSAADLRSADCVIRYTGTQPQRSTGTTDTARRVVWVSSTPPVFGSGYALDGDKWERTP